MVLVCKNISKDRICSTHPINVVSNVSFVVDVQSLDDPNDLKADENDVWERQGSPATYISISDAPIPIQISVSADFYQNRLISV